MKKTLSLIIFLTSLILSTSLYADGIGAYFSGGGGVTKWGPRILTNSKNYFLGGGFIYDSNIGQDKLFNYRLHIGYDRFIANKNFLGMALDAYNVDIKCNRISLMNTFGFGLIRTKHFRFWLGPQLGIKYAYGGYSKTIPQISEPIVLFHCKEYYRFGEINGGIAFGLNFNINSNITVAVDTGFRYGYLIELYYMRSGNSFKIDRYGIKKTQYHNFEGFGNIGVLYRFNESHTEENKK